MLCSLCRKRAVISQRYLGRQLCQDHFVRDFEGRMVQSIERGRMIEEGRGLLWR